jgi:large subunit ribosomal protein L10
MAGWPLGQRSGVKRDEKAAAVEELRSLFSRASAVMLAENRGLSVAELGELRRLLRPQSVTLRMVKNTLAKLATRGTELEGLDRYFIGPTLVAFSEADASAPAKVLATYARTRPTLAVKAAFAEGRVLGREEALALAELPPREVLLGRLAGALHLPLRRAVLALYGPLRSLLAVLEAVRQKQEAGAPRA